jgi:amino acid adenylation domain-containing protein
MSSQPDIGPIEHRRDQPRTAYTRDATVHGHFEEQAARIPDAIAVLFEDRMLTYGELNEGANRLAHRLRRMGMRAGTPVGLCLERSPELIIGLLAILKAGGAYVPLDADYPNERLTLMLRDTGAKVILAHRATMDRLKPLHQLAEVVCLDSPAPSGDWADTANPASGATAEDLAYIVYTSGSTGTPKGVMIEHRAVIRLIKNTNYCNFGPDQVFLHLAPISFDASTFEIWGPLLNGARLAIMPPGAVGLIDLGFTIGRHRVTTLFLTTALFNLAVEQQVEALRPLRQLFNGGEAASPWHFARAIEELRDGAVIHVYGPTESTTFTCWQRMPKSFTVADAIPIGRPIANTTVHLLDEQLRPVDVGATGELCIGGDGLARGYLNNPELTREKFIPDPFSDEPGARLYRTGDLARYLPDGSIEFLGRLDSQVKVLGHRIEPGEIEAILRAHPEISQVVVAPFAGPRGDRRLAAYYVAAGAHGPCASELRDYLADRLPSFMIPASFIALAALPLTPNGKVNRAALPAPEPPTTGGESDPAAAKVESLEERILRLCRGIFHCRVGPDDHFFDMGADSLHLIELHAELQRQLSGELCITELFEHPTVRSLAGRLAGGPDKLLDLGRIRDQARKQKDAFARHKQLRTAP